MKKGVLVIDDDLNICHELKTALENEETEPAWSPSWMSGPPWADDTSRM